MGLQDSPVLGGDHPTAAGQDLAKGADVAMSSEGASQLVQDPLYHPLIGLETQLASDAGLQVMRLIHDEVAIFGQDAVFHRHIGEQKCVVDDDEVRPLGSTPGPVKEAVAPLPEATAIEGAGLAFGRYLAPQRLFDAIGHEQLAPFSCLRTGHPDQYFGQHSHLVRGADTALA